MLSWREPDGDDNHLSSGLEVVSPPSLQTSAAGVVSPGPGACVDMNPAADVGPATDSGLILSEIGDNLLKASGESCHCLWLEEG